MCRILWGSHPVHSLPCAFAFPWNPVLQSFSLMCTFVGHTLALQQTGMPAGPGVAAASAQ